MKRRIFAITLLFCINKNALSQEDACREDRFQESSNREKAQELIKEATTICVFSVESSLKRRPAYVTKASNDGQKEVIVASNKNSQKAQKFFQTNPNASIGLYSSYNNSLTIEGRVEILTDEESCKKYWAESTKDFYRCVPADKRLAMVKFIGEEAHGFISMKPYSFKLNKIKQLI